MCDKLGIVSGCNSLVFIIIACVWSIYSGTGVQILLRAMSVIIEATERNESYSTCLSDYLQVLQCCVIHSTRHYYYLR